MTDVANPLIAARHDTTQWYSGMGLAESVADTLAGFESGSWVDSTIGGLATGLDALATVLDPVGAIVSWGVGWLLEHVKPLSDALDWLAGDPGQITAYAQTWLRIARNCLNTAADYQSAVTHQVTNWSGPSAQAYRTHAAEHLGAINALARAADGMGAIVEGAGLLVALVREIVRDLIADFVATLAARLPMWLAEAGITLGAATPLVVSQVSSLVAKWSARIARFTNALINSLRRLTPILKQLGDITNEITNLLRRLARSDMSAPTYELPGERSREFGHPETDDMGRRSDWVDPAAHPQPPSRIPDSQLSAGDPVYYRPGATAIGYDTRTMRNFDAVAPEPGYHDVVVHGGPDGLFQPGLVGADGANRLGNYTHPNQIAEAIRNNPNYDGGPVRLVSCHTGVAPEGGVSPAQQVADALGVPVIAPTDAVGVMRYGPSGQVPQINNDGYWKTFYPGD